MKLKENRFRLDIRKKTLIGRMVKERLPREVVGDPFLEAFKARLDETPSNLVWCTVSLHMAGRLERDDL